MKITSVRIGALLLLIALFLGAGLLSEWGKGLEAKNLYPEVAELAVVTDWSLQDYQSYFQKLSDRKGALYAFDVLREAPLVPGIDSHLLGHVIGDMLYRERGIKGIQYCTQDFRNACSHSVVIGILLEHGEGSLPEIADTCREAPGGKGAYTMCFHGLGHGVLAYNAYDLTRAVEMCKEVGTKEHNNGEAIECIGGATMEMIAGVHDRGAWEKQVDNYFKQDDALYPCDASFMPDDARGVCYAYLTPRLFMAVGTEPLAPDPELIPKAFSFCRALPPGKDRTACYGGFGKEFVGLTQDSDVRKVGEMDAEDVAQVLGWCSLAGSEGEADCISFALASMFWGGEVSPDPSFLLCESAEGELQDRCYRDLAGHIGYYLGLSNQTRTLCERFPERYVDFCRSQLR